MIVGLADRLRQMRVRAGYSQRHVAKQLGISPSIVSSYETGERTPSVENLLSLAYLLRCSTDYLLGKELGGQKVNINVTGLSDIQVQLLNDLIDTMREK